MTAAAYVEIFHADGSSERHLLDGDRVIGRQPRAGIAIPHATELEPEHLLLSPRSDGCWLSPAEWARTPVVVDGQRFTGGMLPWGSSLNIGSLSLRLVLEQEAPSAAEKPPAVSTPTLLLMVAMLGAAVWLFMGDEGDGLPGMTSVKPPALFADEPTPCPEKDPKAALARAREAAAAAKAKSERYPFAAQDGIQAVASFALAERCFRDAGHEGGAENAFEQRELLERRIEEDYRTHALKLERAIQYRRTRQALLETRELLSLVRHLDGPYTSWLKNMERHLSLKAE